MRSPRPKAAAAAALVVVAVVGPAPRVAAYEFELRARTIGQATELLGVRFTGPDEAIARRRFTQTLALDLWDLGRPRRHNYLREPAYRTGPRLSFSSYLRLDHDFGEFTSGQIRQANRDFDAVDLVPELENGSLQLDVLYAYFAAEELAGGALDLYAGRQLLVGDLDFLAFDGARARLDGGRLPVALEAFAGLRVRETSPAGGPWTELDGTSGGECQEYVEGMVPGSGAWRPIDQRLRDNDPFRNDLDRCPQREELMPVWGAALESARLPVALRLAYRRSVSPTPGLIGPADRFTATDVGYYPDERGQAPAWGVNEEHVTASARAPLALGGKAQLTPRLAARYSLLHGLVEEVHGGLRLAIADHAVEPEVYYVFPTFDGDSIFNVFSIQPYLDGRATWSWAPRGAALAGYLRGWLRRFATEDAEVAEPSARASRFAGGGQSGLRWRARRALARLELFHDAGYGGRRTGGYASGRLAVSSDLSLAAQTSLIHFDEDLRAGLRAAAFGLAAGGTWVIARGIAVTVMVEDNVSRIDHSRFGALALLDLAFQPEL